MNNALPTTQAEITRIMCTTWGVFIHRFLCLAFAIFWLFVAVGFWVFCFFWLILAFGWIGLQLLLLFGQGVLGVRLQVCLLHWLSCWLLLSGLCKLGFINFIIYLPHSISASRTLRQPVTIVLQRLKVGSARIFLSWNSFFRQYS